MGSRNCDENGALDLDDMREGESESIELNDFRPYRVKLSIVYEYIVLAETYADACSLDTAREAVENESIPEPDETWEFSANETELTSLPPGWDEDSYVYGPLENVRVGEVRESLAEREASSLSIGARVYDRRMDLFGAIESISDGPEGRSLADCPARVKYEFPMDPSAESREVRLGDLIAAHKAERIS